MIDAVLDANVVAAGMVGFERADSAPGAIWRAAEAGTIRLVTSEYIVHEATTALTNRYFRQRLAPE